MCTKRCAMSRYIALFRYLFSIAGLRGLCYRILYPRHFGAWNRISHPVRLTSSSLYTGRGVKIYKNCRIEGIKAYAGIQYRPQIVFRQGVSIEQNLHLTCAESVTIGEDTAIAANVTITDIHHPYNDIHTPIEHQSLQVAPVEIGAQCKIYNNVVITPGTQIGKHCTVGANSVVRGTFPDYCVIVGAPAHVIKRYNRATGQWENVG